MPEKWEVTNRELMVFFGSVLTALFIMAGGTMGWFDPLVAGIAVITMVVFFAMAQWLEARGVFGSGMSLVWITLGLGVIMMFAGLEAKGVVPFVIYSSSASLLALELTNAMIYAVVVLSIIAAALAIYVFYFRKGLPLGAKKRAPE
ncbi:hypothetical protein DRP04_04725 [Archaeoglobales archaeon]|nr:MAG: hypothetical protein DRP04_04725 [Archaeoglobales archaeon]